MNVYTTYTWPLSGQAQYSRSCTIISSSCYNSSLVTWTVERLTAPKFKPLIYPEAEAEAEAYCRQPAGTVTPGIGPRWDPWPCICSMSRDLFCFSYCWSSLLIKEGLVFYIYIEWCLLTTPYLYISRILPESRYTTSAPTAEKTSHAVPIVASGISSEDTSHDSHWVISLAAWPSTSNKL
jgi:hypothetical protein